MHAVFIEFRDHYSKPRFEFWSKCFNIIII